MSVVYNGIQPYKYEKKGGTYMKDWNGKAYLWFKDISEDITGIHGDNYFIEIETD